MNDRTYLCSICEQPVWESAPHEHEETLIPPTSPVEQKGQWWPLNREQVLGYLSHSRQTIEVICSAEVLDAHPTAKNIRIIFHPWINRNGEEQDPDGNALAREHYGYPEDTMGTLGWKADFPEETP